MGETAPAFQQMMDNIERLAQRPRVSGSYEIEIVRAKIIDEIKEMGLVPIIHKAEFSHAEAVAAHIRLLGQSYVLPARFFRGERLHLQNILVKLQAPNAERGIMFVSHYDSWFNSPGAADAMLGVCAMLEAMRAHVNNETLTNSLYFLFTEGEEFGALGALAFVEAHPELKERIDMVINLEARGTRGGVIVFETSLEAYSVLRLFKRVTARPIGFSVAQAIYDRMHVRTDFTFFKEHGYKGINLVILEGAEHYHRPSDTIENLDKATAWQYLSIVLALADYAANNSLEELRMPSRRAVFFPFLPGNLVLLSFVLAYFLCAIACFLAFAYIAFQYKKQRLKISFSIALLVALAVLSIISAIFLHSGSYLFWLPLLVMSVCMFLKKWPAAFRAAQMLTGITALLLWVPLFYLVLVMIAAG